MVFPDYGCHFNVVICYGCDTGGIVRYEHERVAEVKIGSARYMREYLFIRALLAFTH